MTTNPLPSLSSLRKTDGVEDPVNTYFNRTVAYAILCLIYRTPITPNQTTMIAGAVGFAAAAAWYIESPTAMVVGGILLWTSAILDGVDGLLARARKMQSQLGRALDGMVDALVAIVTLCATTRRIWHQTGQDWVVYACILLVWLTSYQMFAYDHYKESFVRFTDPTNRERESIKQMSAFEKELREQGAPWHHRAAAWFLRSSLVTENRLVALTNPRALREGRHFHVTEQSAAIYRKHNLGPMRVWVWVSPAPHSYIMAILGMFDRLDIYMWLRLTVFNALFVIALLWQRYASTQTDAELARLKTAPEGLVTE